MAKAMASVTFLPGDWVWTPHEEYLFVPGIVEKVYSSGGDQKKRIAVVYVKYSCASVPAYPPAPSDEIKEFPVDCLIAGSEEIICNPDSVPDIIHLPRLTEPSVLFNLSKRFYKGDIYTSISSMIISINPHRSLGLYDSSYLRKYSLTSTESEPHIYRVSRDALKHMRKTGKSQSILISGVSGAGKTECTKLVLKYLIHCSGTENDIEKHLLDSNPVLESFGNAKTLCNDNSSRFGRWTSVIFDKSSMEMVSGKLTGYLLEENRVTRHNHGERNFHILYQACYFSVDRGKGVEDAETKVLDPAKFDYLDDAEIQGVSDREQLGKTLKAMGLCEIGPETQREIFRILKGILYLGNVKLTGDSEKVNVDDKSLNVCCKLLQIDKSEALNALKFRSLQISGGDSTPIQVPLSCPASKDSRDALAKRIYRHLFKWILNHINMILDKNVDSLNRAKTLDVKRASMYEPSNQYVSLGVLDIFGFEMFERNGLEQFLINYANERLQQHFLHSVFKIELDLFLSEGIDTSEISYVDNSITVNMLDNGRYGIIALLNDELSFPKSTAETFTSKVNETLKSSGFVIARKLLHENCFTISHFAGDVTYHTDDFIDKSRNLLSLDLLNVLKNTRSEFVCEIFGWELRKEEKTTAKVFRFVGSALGISRNQRSRKLSSDHRQKEKGHSIGMEFRIRLNELMKMINSTQSHFVRCIKPNESKSPLFLHASMVLHQLKCSGMMETVRIRKTGFPERFTFSQFLVRYSLIAGILKKSFKSGHISNKPIDKCRFILQLFSEKQSLNSNLWALGHSRVFMQSSFMHELNVCIENNTKSSVVDLQRVIRSYFCVKKYKRMVEVYSRLVQTVMKCEKGKLESYDSIMILIMECERELIPNRFIQKLEEIAKRIEAQRKWSEAVERKVETISEKLKLLEEACDESDNHLNLIKKFHAFVREFRRLRGICREGEEYSKQLIKLIASSSAEVGMKNCTEVESAQTECESIMVALIKLGDSTRLPTIPFENDDDSLLKRIEKYPQLLKDCEDLRISQDHVYIISAKKALEKQQNEIQILEYLKTFEEFPDRLSSEAIQDTKDKLFAFDDDLMGFSGRDNRILYRKLLHSLRQQCVEIISDLKTQRPKPVSDDLIVIESYHCAEEEREFTSYETEISQVSDHKSDPEPCSRSECQSIVQRKSSKKSATSVETEISAESGYPNSQSISDHHSDPEPCSRSVSQPLVKQNTSKKSVSVAKRVSPSTPGIPISQKPAFQPKKVEKRLEVDVNAKQYDLGNKIRSPTLLLDYPTMSRPAIGRAGQGKRRNPKINKSFLDDIQALLSDEEIPEFVRPCSIEKNLILHRSSDEPPCDSPIVSRLSFDERTSPRKGKKKQRSNSPVKLKRSYSPRRKTEQLWRKKTVDERIEDILVSLEDPNSPPILGNVESRYSIRSKPTKTSAPIKLNISVDESKQEMPQRPVSNPILTPVSENKISFPSLSVKSRSPSPVELRASVEKGLKKKTDSIETLANSGRLRNLAQMFESKSPLEKNSPPAWRRKK